MTLPELPNASLKTTAAGATDPLRLLVAAWLAGYKAPTTRAVYGIAVRQWLDWCADHQLDPLKVIRAHIELWQRELEAAGKKPRTVANRIGAVACWYGYLVEEDVLTVDPAARVKRPKIERKSPTAWLTRPQLADLVTAAEQLGGSPHALICLLALNGLRIAEACSLNVESLTWAGGYPVVDFTRKGGKDGRATLARPTEAAVLAAIGDRTTGPLLLTAAGTRMNQKAAQRIIDRCMPHVRGTHGRITPHALRHSWCTAAHGAHVPTDQLQHDGGWADPRMATYYAHGQDQPDRATTHAVTAFIAGAK